MTIDGDIDGDDVADITVSGNDASRVILVDSGTATLDALVITEGNGGSDGGGILVNAGAELVLTNSTVTGNRAEHAGGILNLGIITLNNSTISHNRTAYWDGDGGGLYNLGTATLNNSQVSQNHAGGAGGGVLNGGTLTLGNSTVSDNIAAGYYFYGGGGGLFNWGTATLTNSTISGNYGDTGGGILNEGTATLTNSTLSGNEAWVGGAIANNTTVILTNTTISGNEARIGGGIENLGTATLNNSIVLGNSADEEYKDGAEVSNYGTFAASTSLYGAHGETAADVFAALDGSGGGLLADNGGPVPTIALNADPSNPALDSGDDTVAPTTDAAGQARSDIPGVSGNGGNISDLGAVELQTSFSGDDEANTIQGTGFADTIYGNGGFDMLYGRAGDDFVFGGDGNDQLFGGLGADTLHGGNAADQIAGGAHDDVLRGEAGNDVLLGENGNDLLFGGLQNDRLFGDAGEDRLRGGDGEDVLVGGLGADLLFGGAGADIFAYLSADDSPDGSNADRIFDFASGEDLIGLRQASPGAIDFVGTSAFSGAGSEVRLVETPNGNTRVFVDVDGDTSADMQIVVLGATGLTENDFIL